MFNPDSPEWHARKKDAESVISEVTKKMPKQAAYICDYTGKELYSTEECLKHMEKDKMNHRWIRAVRPLKGDHLVRWDGSSGLTVNGLPEHHGICIAEDDYFGSSMVAHFTKNKGVEADAFSDFAGASNVYVWPHAKRLEPKRTVERASSMVGKSGFHAIYNNCEHFASWAVLGEKKSRQLWGLGGAFTAVSGAWHAGGYMVGGALGFAAAHGAFVVGKWCGLAYLGSDAAERNWDSIQRTLTVTGVDGPKRCCMCKQKKEQ